MNKKPNCVQDIRPCVLNANVWFGFFEDNDEEEKNAIKQCIFHFFFYKAVCLNGGWGRFFEEVLSREFEKEGGGLVWFLGSQVKYFSR